MNNKEKSFFENGMHGVCLQRYLGEQRAHNSFSENTSTLLCFYILKFSICAHQLIRMQFQHIVTIGNKIINVKLYISFKCPFVYRYLISASESLMFPEESMLSE